METVICGCAEMREERQESEHVRDSTLESGMWGISSTARACGEYPLERVDVGDTLVSGHVGDTLWPSLVPARW